jgi:hypothetical protein
LFPAFDQLFDPTGEKYEWEAGGVFVSKKIQRGAMDVSPYSKGVNSMILETCRSGMMST